MKYQIETLENLFSKFNHDLFENELVMPMITVQTKGRKKNVLGWCSVIPFWGENDEKDENNQSNNDESEKQVTMYYEINICAEYLNRGLLEISETLLHEMVHLSNCQKGIKDCGKNGSHNKNFKEECDKIGLFCNKDSKYGWCVTSLSPMLTEYIESLNINDVFNVARVVGDKKAGKPPTPTFKYICPECGALLKSKIEGLKIECKECEVLFEEG